MGIVVVVDGRQRAKEQAGDVGEGGGAASGDAIAGDEFIKLAEGMVDTLRGLKLDGSFGQRGIEIGVLVERSFLGEVVGAEAGLRVRAEQTTLVAAGGKDVVAAGLRRHGLNCWFRHGAW